MAREEQSLSSAPDASFSLEARNSRLEKLVGELLATNQQLRFQVDRLERAKNAAESALVKASAGAALLLP
ncbi:MAG: hypothetical protein JST28_00450 [Acidobacteria bacterium]|nr:hypothetical protein [Acidobacteriota bacterium]